MCAVLAVFGLFVYTVCVLTGIGVYAVEAVIVR